MTELPDGSSTSWLTTEGNVWHPEQVGELFSRDELKQAARNHGMPLEGMRHDLTPAGMHYLLIHYDIPAVDAADHALEITGAVGNPLTLSIDDLKAMPGMTTAATMECAGNGRTLYETWPQSQPWINEAVGTAKWTGVPVTALLDAAGIADDAVEVVFTGLDRGIEGGEEQNYERSLTVKEIRRGDALIAHSMNEQPLLPQHGAPLRLLVPGSYGMTNVKWLTRMTAVREPFDGYQHRVSYRLRSRDEDPGTPVTRIGARSLMIPPGIPTFPTRKRTVEAGRHLLEGRAWSGHAPIVRVQISTDGGSTWKDAGLDPPMGQFTWRRWSHEWIAEPGEHVLASRATDGAGNEQPAVAEWNTGGFANNGIQKVEVTVRG